MQRQHAITLAALSRQPESHQHFAKRGNGAGAGDALVSALPGEAITPRRVAFASLPLLKLAQTRYFARLHRDD